MKKQISKKNVYICIAVLLLVAMLVVGKAYFFPSRVNPIIVARIELDYAKQNGVKRVKYMPPCYYFGIYHGCIPVYFDGAATDMAWTETVAGVSFKYPDGNLLRVWENGRFMRLEEAYSEGLLSKEDLETIAYEYHNWKYSLRD